MTGHILSNRDKTLVGRRCATSLQPIIPYHHRSQHTSASHVNIGNHTAPTSYPSSLITPHIHE
jgi:hypothetical protein